VPEGPAGRIYRGTVDKQRFAAMFEAGRLAGVTPAFMQAAKDVYFADSWVADKASLLAEIVDGRFVGRSHPERRPGTGRQAGQSLRRSEKFQRQSRGPHLHVES
jgi:hypothetical protein